MQAPQGVSFGPYRLTGPQGPLVLKSQTVNLPPKAVAILWVLVAHAGQVVTKEELFTTIWPETVVGEETLTSFIHLLRRALKEDSRRPRYVATVHRVGYRFIAPVQSPESKVQSQEEERQKAKGKTQRSKVEDPTPSTQHLAPVLVGREAELTQLHNLFVKALNGDRQVVFVTGEAGIGKTTLVDTFLLGVQSHKEFGVHEQGENQKAEIKRQKTKITPFPLAPNTQHRAPVFIAYGQCVEHYGAGEAYLPVLEALGRLGRGPHKAPLLSVLQQYAPTWLVQLPALLSAAELEAVQPRAQGATRERMLREITEALQVLTAEHSLVLVLEDLHWSDPSTVELLAMLARQREAARLLVLGTYRPTELVVTNHPLKVAKQELVARGQGTEVLLGGLTRDAVRSYVTQRLGTVAARDELAVLIHRRTEGHPLFIVQVTDYLVQHDGLTVQSAADIPVVEQTLPHGLQELIEAQLGRLTEDEQRVLAVGSVGGAEFTVASVAAGLAKAEPVIEEICERLAGRGQFIEERAIAKWPDGTLSGRYGFRHALYQQALYQRLAEARRVRLHRAIGERIEAGHSERTNEIAAELAMHFERGQDTDRTVLYRQKAGENALQRWAYQEALGHFQKGVEFLQVLPATSDRARREVALQFLLMQATIPVKGHASREVECIYTHTLALCEQNGTARQLFFVLLGLFRICNARGEYQQARGLGAQCLALAQREHDPALFFPAYYALGASELYLGNFAAAKEYLTQGIRRYDTQHDTTYVALYGNANPYNFCWVYAATALWFLGYPDQAVQHTEEMLRLAEGFSSPLTVAGTRGFAPLVYHCCRQGARVQEQAEEGIAVATRMGFPFWRAIGLFWRGWALAEQEYHEEGIQQMQQGLGAQRETGSSVHRVHFMILLAEAHGRAGQVEEGLRLLAEAEMEKTEERFYEAELWRLRGELTLETRDWGLETSSSLQAPSLKPLVSEEALREAEECFQKAIAIARQQQAKSLELRAVMSLVRLRQQQAAPQVSRTTYHVSRTALTEAHRILSEVYGWFTEGFETKDLREAKALLQSLESSV